MNGPGKMRIVGRLVGAVALLAGALVAVMILLWPPSPLVVRQQDFAIAGVTIVNPGRGQKSNQRIQIHAGRIKSITANVPGLPYSPDVHRYAGAYVLPGLIDMHVHHPAAVQAFDVRLFELLYLAYGVTAVRDAGSFDGSIFNLRSRVARGELAGPRIFACGPVIDGDPPTWPGIPGFVVAHNRVEAERAADQAAAKGADCIKAYQNLTPDALNGLRDAATRHHLPLIGHVPFAVPLERAHLDDIQHLTGVPLVAWKRSSSSTEGLRELLHEWEGIDDAWIDAVVRISIEQHLTHTPTIIVIDQITRLVDYPALLGEPDAHMLPRYYRELLWKPGGSFNAQAFVSPPPQDPDRIRVKVRALVGKLHDAGVTLHVGTDTLNPFVVPGVSLHRELRNFVESGFTPEEALAAATSGNGAALPEPGLGTIAEGAPADLIVLHDDPTRDLAALSTIEAVIANGRFYSKATLEAALARYRAKLGGLSDSVGLVIARLMMGAPASSPGTPAHL
jgi:hypothetical protein